MKIESVYIKNFRCFKEETINFDDYTCFVGPNGAGKSTVFSALNVFFREFKDSKTDLSILCVNDFHHKNTQEPIKIQVTFKDLSDEAKIDFAAYVRQEKLIITVEATYDQKTEKAEVKQYGSRLIFEDFAKYFEADKEKAKKETLDDIYKKLREKYPDLPAAKTKGDMEVNLKNYEAARPSECILKDSPDEFYGVSKGKNLLEKYIQWIFIPAIKDATEESEETKDSALGQLLARTVRSEVDFTKKIEELKNKSRTEYKAILDSEQTALQNISASLEKRMKTWAHPNISAKLGWKEDSEKSVKIDPPWAHMKIGEHGFEGELARFGLGLQRSYLLALLQELSDINDQMSPRLIMCIEEPEIYQHPPQARYMAETLHKLTESNSQILVCSHSPLFIPGDDFEKLRVVREKGNPSSSYVSSLTYAKLAKVIEDAGDKLLQEKGMLAKLYPLLNPTINEMFFCNILVLVEGLEDVAYLTTYLLLTNQLENFRKNGCHVVPTGGKDKIVKSLAITNLLDIPTFTICDADTNETCEDKIIKQKKDNKAILNLTGNDKKSEWTQETIWEENLIMWKTNISDAPKEELKEVWEKYSTETCTHYGDPGSLQKNPLVIGRILETAWNDNHKSKTLEKMISNIISFAENKNSH